MFDPTYISITQRLLELHIIQYLMINLESLIYARAHSGIVLRTFKNVVAQTQLNSYTRSSPLVSHLSLVSKMSSLANRILYLCCLVRHSRPAQSYGTSCCSLQWRAGCRAAGFNPAAKVLTGRTPRPAYRPAYGFGGPVTKVLTGSTPRPA